MNNPIHTACTQIEGSEKPRVFHASDTIYKISYNRMIHSIDIS